MFQDFDKKTVEKGARKRKAASLGAAVAVYVAVGLGLLYAATGTRERPAREKPLEVTFAPSALKAPAAPVKAEKPKPRPVKKIPRAPRLAKKSALVPPKEIPKGALKEADPALLEPVEMTQSDLEERGDVLAGVPGGSGEVASDVDAPVRARRAREEEEAVAEPVVQPPVYLPETARPPRPVEDNPLPQMPAGKRKAGTRHLVVLKVIITESGRIEVVKVLKGDPDFVSAVMEVLPQWRFEPAVFEGEAIRVFKILEIPFQVRG